jgi:hypothetical protein
LDNRERLNLADLRLREMFTLYAKNNATTGGKTLTFDKISKGIEGLGLAALIKMLKDHGIEHTKIKVQFLFKRYAIEGGLLPYVNFLQVVSGLLSDYQSTIFNNQLSSIMNTQYGIP